jgi:hypothetical protein
MKKIFYLTFLLWIAVALLNAQQADTTKTDTLPSYGALEVLVLDAETLEPLPGALVIPQGFGETQSTKIDGRCIFTNIVPGTYRLKILMMGYEPFLTKEIKIINSTRKLKLKIVSTANEFVI